MLSFFSTKLMGQDTNEITPESQVMKAEPGLEKIIPEKDTVEQMVNVAYKTIEKQDLPGAITVLNPGDYINRDYNFSVAEGMVGRVGGLLGNDNIWNIGNALVMIDGIPRYFSDIRLEEVEQITILKGVNAVALYGSHAAHGVILITSKRGEAYNRKLNVRANAGLGLPKLYPEYLGSAEYMVLYNEACTNDGLPEFYDEETINNYTNGNRYRYPDIDYYSSEYINKNTYNTDVFTEFSGGNKDARFYSNIGWANQSTLLNIGEGKNEADNRFNVRGNVDINLNNFISSTVDVAARLENSRRGLADYWYSASTFLPNKYTPLLPVSMIAPDSTDVLLLAENSKNIIDGQYILGGTQEYLTNPLADLYVGGYLEYVNRVLQLTNTINIDLNSVVKGLSFCTRFNADYYNAYIQSINNEYSVYAPIWDSIPDSDIITGLEKFGNDIRTGDLNIEATAQTRNLGFSMQFNYTKSLSDIHNISAILLASGTSITTNGIIQASTNTNLGLQLGYNYKHRYWLDFSSAIVNSTKLPEINRVGFSPTFSLGWLVSSEDFLSGSTVVNHLKLSASAGIINTDRSIGEYYLYDNIYISDAFFSWDDDLYRNQATTSLQGANPDLSFVKRKELNMGIEGAFFKRLLWLETTFFLTQFDGLPTQRFSQYPNYFSDFVPYSNYNSNQITGMDIMLNFNNKIGEIEFNLGVNATYVNTKVIKRDELFADSYMNRVGKPVDAIFGLVNNGFFMDENDITNHPVQAFGEVRPGDIKYVDQNGDNIINERDEVEIGRWNAPFVYGLIFSTSYKDTRNTATYPRLSSLENNNNFRYSDFWIYKTDRFDLSKVQVTYNLPENFVGKTFIREMGVYVMGSNLLTFSKNKDILDLVTWTDPLMRYYSLGIRANF